MILTSAGSLNWQHSSFQSGCGQSMDSHSPSHMSPSSCCPTSGQCASSGLACGWGSSTSTPDKVSFKDYFATKHQQKFGMNFDTTMLCFVNFDSTQQASDPYLKVTLHQLFSHSNLQLTAKTMYNRPNNSWIITKVEQYLSTFQLGCLIT